MERGLRGQYLGGTVGREVLSLTISSAGGLPVMIIGSLTLEVIQLSRAELRKGRGALSGEGRISECGRRILHYENKIMESERE